MNKIEVHPKTEEIKKIWLENREKLSTYAIWNELVKNQYGFKQSDMFIFYKTVQRWEREKIEEVIRGMSHWEIKRLQKENRRMATILLNRRLKRGLESPKTEKFSGISQILKLFNLIEKLGDHNKSGSNRR